MSVLRKVLFGRRRKAPAGVGGVKCQASVSDKVSPQDSETGSGLTLSAASAQSRIEVSGLSGLFCVCDCLFRKICKIGSKGLDNGGDTGCFPVLRFFWMGGFGTWACRTCSLVAAWLVHSRARALSSCECGGSSYAVSLFKKSKKFG